MMSTMTIGKKKCDASGSICHIKKLSPINDLTVLSPFSSLIAVTLFQLKRRCWKLKDAVEFRLVKLDLVTFQEKQDFTADWSKSLKAAISSQFIQFQKGKKAPSCHSKGSRVIYQQRWKSDLKSWWVGLVWFSWCCDSGMSHTHAVSASDGLFRQKRNIDLKKKKKALKLEKWTETYQQ